MGGYTEHENLHKVWDWTKLLRYPSTQIVVCNISVENTRCNKNILADDTFTIPLFL
jgi:hypothetical protein